MAVSLTVLVGLVVVGGFLVLLVFTIAGSEQRANRRAIKDLSRRFDGLRPNEPNGSHVGSPTDRTHKIGEPDNPSGSTK